MRRSVDRQTENDRMQITRRQASSIRELQSTNAVANVQNVIWRINLYIRWLSSGVVSVLESGAEGPGFKSQPRRCLRQTVHTHRASVHQAAKLVAALLRVVKVTAGLAENNGILPPGLCLTSPAG